jgi:hypothetical protein
MSLNTALNTLKNMAKQFSEITTSLKTFIEQQRIFFVGTADVDGRVNVSPKGSDSLRVVGNNRVVWLNLTGSGNETSAHMAATNRITIMFCSFDEKPMILRLYGRGQCVQPKDSAWDKLAELFPENIGARQIFDITIDLVQTSCGFQVPFYEYKSERDLLDKWAEKKGRDGIEQYWEENNKISLDGKPTGI